jgi:hypothetical protein
VSVGVSSVPADRRRTQTWAGDPKQHVDLHRKVLMRRNLLRVGVPGAAYVPFIGDGDIAAQIYRDRRIYGADLDPNRTAVAEHRLPAADIRVADCDQWPFPGLDEPIAIADFDAYGYPYHAFRAFWEHAVKADRLAMFFTDGQGLNIEWKGRWHEPDGTLVKAPGFEQGKSGGDLLVRRKAWSTWFSKHLWPWLCEQLGDEWRPIHRYRYIRGILVYWGVVIERR